MAHDWIIASRLWLVLDRHAADPRTLPEVTRLAVSGGVDAGLCRIKDARSRMLHGWPRKYVQHAASLPHRL